MSESITEFIRHNYRHFNARSLQSAAQGWCDHLDGGGKMLLSMAGAMSTAELGLSLAEMIRQDKIHAICCTGANLEEDLYNLIAHSHYRIVEDYRSLSAQDEQKLHEQKLCRVTDTCIPEEQAMSVLYQVVLDQWQATEARGERLFPHQHLFAVLKSGILEEHYEIDPKDSWMLAAAEKNLPMFVPGWEDSTLGNMFAAACIKGQMQVSSMKSGIEYMISLSDWYQATAPETSIGFFQIGGGIAGDFPICVVPMIRLDLERKDMPYWGYFCQVSDSTTSYGSYSGAVPNEKITWDKISVDTPTWIIESDATIVAPLVFNYVLGR